MNEFILIALKYDVLNGFMFSFIHIETTRFDGALLGLFICPYKYDPRFIVDFLFFRFEIKSPL